MSTFRNIRERLGVTQAQMARDLGLSQGNVSFYEKGQTIPPKTARKLIELAHAKGIGLTFDHVYGAAELPPVTAEGAPATAGAVRCEELRPDVQWSVLREQSAEAEPEKAMAHG